MTAAQVLSGNKSLALLFPWRPSVVLVPIASSVILGGIVSAVFQIFSKPISRIVRPLQSGIVVLIVILCYSGVRHTKWLLSSPKVGVTASTRFVAGTFQPGNLYLIPPDVQSFRLAARVPILVDRKSHPYRDTEIVEWFNRVEVAKHFYAASAETACGILQSISVRYSISHVVIENESALGNCEIVQELYKDPDRIVYGVRHY